MEFRFPMQRALPPTRNIGTAVLLAMLAAGTGHAEKQEKGNPPGAEFVPEPAPADVRARHLAAWQARPGADTLRGGNTWQPLGPSPGFTGGAPDWHVNGRCTAIAVDPTNSSTIWLGAATGGVWKSTDGGETWVHKTPRGSISGLDPSRVLVMAVGSIAISPADHNTVYIGTGEPNNANDCYYGQGILKTTDGGETWTLLGSAEFGWSSVSSIVIDPTNPNIIHAGSCASQSTSSSIVRTIAVDPATGVLPPLGVYKSTDAGATWTRKLVGRVSSLVMDPNDPQRLYAGFRRGTFSGVPTTSGVWTSGDGGETWLELNGTRGLPPAASVARTEIAISPIGSPARIAVAYEDINSRTTMAGLYESTDGGANFVLIQPPDTSCQCFYAFVLAYDPFTAGRLFFGMLDINRTDNSGGSWLTFFDIHVDQQGIAFDPQVPDSVWAVTDGGVYHSLDGGLTWNDQGAGGLSVIQFEGIDVPQDDSPYVIGGTQDNGTLVWNGAGETDWERTAGADGGWALVHRSIPNIVFHNTQFLFGLERSHSRGSAGSWLSANSGISQSDRTSFYTPFVPDPSVHERIYLGTYRLYRTQNASTGTLWAVRSADVTTGLFEPSGAQDTISAIGISKTNPQRIYVGSKLNANLRRSDDGGATFPMVVSPPVSTPALAGVAWIEVDPTDENIVYAGTNELGHPGEHLWKSTNGGASWLNIDQGNLPPVPVICIAVDSANPSRVWVGGDAGVWQSVDAGASWSPLNDGLPYVPVFQLRHQPARNRLIAATHGRGAWELPLSPNSAADDWSSY